MLTINRLDLTQALASAVKLVRHAPRPDLKTVRLSACADGVEMVATNAESWMQQRLPGLGNGTTVQVEATALHAAVKNLQAQEVSLQTGEDGVVLQAGAMKAMLPLHEADLPVPTDDNWRSITVVSSDELHQALDCCLPFLCKGISRYSLEGVSLRAGVGEPLALATSDTARLSVCTVGARSEEVDLILPSAAATVLSRMPTTGDVEIQVTSPVRRNDDVTIDTTKPPLPPTAVSFTNCRWRFVSRVLDGRFPMYEGVIPRNLPYGIRVRRRAFLNELKQAGQLTNPETQRVTLSHEDGDLILEAENGRLVSRASVGRNMTRWAGNWKYLHDALKVCQGDEVVLRIQNAQTPLRIDVDRWTHVIMPIL